MTVNELVDYISDTLNLNGADARTRILRELNLRYKQVTSAIGMATSRRAEVSKTATIASQFITFTGAEKLEAVYRKVGTKVIRLDLLSNEEMLEESLVTEPPTKYSIYTTGPNTVTVKLNCIAITAYTLYGMGVTDVSTLTNTDRPAFPESFHDVLVYGVLADEYRRKDKGQAAKDADQSFTNRLSDLRMFIAKSAYMDIYRGKHTKADGWWDSQQGQDN